MENENNIADLYYEVVIFEIDRNNQNIAKFDDDTLFMHIYHFYCFLIIFHLIMHGKKRLYKD